MPDDEYPVPPPQWPEVVAAVSNYALCSGEQSHAAHPDTFWIPDLYLRRHLRPRDHAKLMFDFGDGGVERMWVEVTSCQADPDGNTVRYGGVLGNTPVLGDYLDFGDPVEFEPHHVIDVLSMEDM